MNVKSESHSTVKQEEGRAHRMAPWIYLTNGVTYCNTIVEDTQLCTFTMHAYQTSFMLALTLSLTVALLIGCIFITLTRMRAEG